MRYFLFALFISCYATAQNFDDYLKKLEQRSENRAVTLKEIDNVINKVSDISNYPELLFYKSRIYDEYDNLALAIKTLLEAKKHAKDYKLRFYILNNLGVDYQLTLDFENARKAFQEAILNAEKLNDEAELNFAKEKLLYLDMESEASNGLKAYKTYLFTRDYGGDNCSKLYTLTQIAEYYNINEQFKNAKRLFNKVKIDLGKLNMADCSCSIQLYYELKAEIAIEDKNYSKAIKSLDSIPFHKIINPCEKTFTYKMYKKAHEELGNQAIALKYNDTIISILDNSLQQFNDTNAASVTKTEEEKNQANKKISFLNILLLILVAIILLVILFLIYSKKARLKLQSSLNFHKDKYNNLWANYQLSTKQLEKLKEELINQENAGVGNRELKMLLKDLSIHLNTSKDDEHKHINILKDNFISSLQEKAPYLNNQEQLVCFFINLNFSHKKIGELLNKSEKSIESYKYRINSKVKTHQKTTVDELLDSLSPKN